MLTERQINTFKTAVDAQFGTDAIGILESATVAPAEPTTPEPHAPTAPSAPTAPDVEPAIDVEVTTATDTPATDFPDRASSQSDINRHRNIAQQPEYSVNPQAGIKEGSQRTWYTSSDRWEVKSTRYKR
jgi:septal ring-binding cell division protein DamX